MPVSLLLAALFNGIGETVFSEKLFWNDIALAWLYMNNLYPLSHYANISDNEPI